MHKETPLQTQVETMLRDGFPEVEVLLVDKPTPNRVRVFIDRDASPVDTDLLEQGTRQLSPLHPAPIVHHGDRSFRGVGVDADPTRAGVQRVGNHFGQDCLLETAAVGVSQIYDESGVLPFVRRTAVFADREHRAGAVRPFEEVFSGNAVAADETRAHRGPPHRCGQARSRPDGCKPHHHPPGSRCPGGRT